MVVRTKDKSQWLSSPSSNKEKKSKSNSRIRKAERIRRKALKILRDQTDDFQMINPNAAGIDVGSETMLVAVPADRAPEPVRWFHSYTEDLHRLADWLVQCNITTVAMESTSTYWEPLFDILERRGIEVCLVNARHAKNLPGRKTDVIDCQWLQKLHTFGLLAASFRPPDEIRVLRTICRRRKTIIQDAGAQVQHMQAALTLMNVLVHKAITDITGKTGISIIEAILDGERDPERLAELRDYRCKKDTEQIAKYLNGNYRDEHLFILKQAYESWQHTQKQMHQCDWQIEKILDSFDQETEDTLVKKPRSKPKQNDVDFDLPNYLYQITGVDLTAIYGISSLTALTLVSEIGTDMTPWKTSEHFSSWLGLCPNNRISGGKILGVGTRKVANRLAIALRVSAKSLQRSRNSLGAFFRRMAYKLGYQAAVTATAHKLARIIYTLLKYKREFDPQLLDSQHQLKQEHTLRCIKQAARTMGYKLVPVTETNETQDLCAAS